MDQRQERKGVVVVVKRAESDRKKISTCSFLLIRRVNPVAVAIDMFKVVALGATKRALLSEVGGVCSAFQKKPLPTVILYKAATVFGRVTSCHDIDTCCGAASDRPPFGRQVGPDSCYWTQRSFIERGYSSLSQSYHSTEST
jgi:hypothetical protein